MNQRMKMNTALNMCLFLIICLFYKVNSAYCDYQDFPITIDHFFEDQIVKVNLLDASGTFFDPPISGLSSPFVDINDNGEYLIVWRIQNEGIIRAAGNFNGSDEIETLEIDTSNIDDFAYMWTIGINEAGHKFIAWVGLNTIYFSYAKPNDSFTVPNPIFENHRGDYLYGGIDGNGNVLLVYNQWDEEGINYNTVQSINYNANTDTWSEPYEIGERGQASGGLSLTMSENGKGILLWQKIIEGDYGLYATQFSFDESGEGAWAPSLLLSQSLVYHTAVIDTDKIGNAMVVWAESENYVDQTDGKLISMIYSPFDGWSEKVPIPMESQDPYILNPGRPKLSINEKGDAIVTYEMYRKIYANRFDRENGWSEATMIRGNQAGDPDILQPDIDDDGKIVTFWRPEAFDRVGRVEFRRYDPSYGWLGYQSLNFVGYAYGGWFLNISFNSKGIGIFGWEESNLVWNEEDGVYNSLSFALSAGPVDFYSMQPHTTDSDSDGILDDNNGDGQIDNHCIEGNTVGCDDNCQYHYNPDQTDTDNDGIGNVCDDDDDNDGMDDNWENDYGLDPLSDNSLSDEDGDGLTDLEEYHLYTNPISSDSDGDGMPDGWEVEFGLGIFGNDAESDPDNDGYTNLEEYNLNRNPKNMEPDTPVLISPENYQNAISLSVELRTDRFSDGDYDDHFTTHWQISSDNSFSSELIVFDITSQTNLTLIKIPDYILEYGKTYFWRAKFSDDRNASSYWSDIFNFETAQSTVTDSNNNGIPDNREVNNSNLDLDNNGVIDIYQADMKCIVSSDKKFQTHVKLGPNAKSIDFIEPIAESSIFDFRNKPADLDFRLIGFRMKTENIGDSAELIFYFEEPAPSDAVWYKYDKLNGWQDYSSYSTFSADRSFVTLSLQDGGVGDSDCVANGIIVDPSGYGFVSPDDSSNNGSESSGGGGGGGCFVHTLLN